MAIVAEPDFMDGFDALSAAQVSRKWNVGSPATISSPGRSGITGTQAVGGFGSMRKAVTASNGGLMQFGFRTPNAFAAGTNTVIAAFYNSLSGGRGTTLEYTTTGVLVLKNGQTLATLASATDPLQSLVPSTWYYFEFGQVAHLTLGTADVRLNGVNVAGLFGLSGIATSNATNQFDTVEIMSIETGSLHDDFYYRTAPSGYNSATDFLGDIVIETLYPDAVSGDAGHTQGTIYGTATNRFDGLDEANASDDETSGVDLTANGQKLYTSMGSLAGPAGATIGTIHAIQLNIIARKTDPGFSHAITPGAVKVGSYGTDYLGSSQALQDTFSDKRKAWAVRPNDAAAWTTTDVATGWEFGVQRDS